MRRNYYVGVMSGTSVDGVDAVLAELDEGRCTLVGAVFRPFDPALRRELLELQTCGDDELARAAGAANTLADAYAGAITALLDESGVAAAEVVAAGVHGQTVRHRPEQGWTLQLNNPARVAEHTGLTVVADFRSRDVAAGGHGAPLVPAFHASLFSRPDVHRVIVNIGGIANVTDLPSVGGLPAVRGFDVGPGNVLLDLWCERHRGEPFDRDGEWARSGRVDAALLRLLREEPFFAAPPPKSTGRDLFNRGWLDSKLAQYASLDRRTIPARDVQASLDSAPIAAHDVPAGSDSIPIAALDVQVGSDSIPIAARDVHRSLDSLPIAAHDVQATLLALTVHAIADAVTRHCAGASEMLVCGGGANNKALMSALSQALRSCRVTTTASYGVAVEHVEALAFAWLAREALAGRPGNLPAVTGARGSRVLGAIYPGV